MSARPAVTLSAILGLALLVGLAATPARAVEQGTITVKKTWAQGQQPGEGLEVCFTVSADAAGADVLKRACTTDETYTVTFGPSDPPLQTGVTYYVAEEVGQTWEVVGDNPVAVTIPDTSGAVAMTFENRRATAGSGSIEVHNSACPAGAAKDTLFDECHANGRTGVDMALQGPVNKQGTTAGGLGTVVFDGLPAGAYTLAEAAMSGDFAEYVVFCADATTKEQVPIDYRGDGRAAVAFDLAAGQAVVCDWFNIPAASQPSAAPRPSAQPQLPNTGAGSSALAAPNGALPAVAAVLLLTVMAVIGARRHLARSRRA